MEHSIFEESIEDPNRIEFLKEVFPNTSFRDEENKDFSITRRIYTTTPSMYSLTGKKSNVSKEEIFVGRKIDPKLLTVEIFQNGKYGVYFYEDEGKEKKLVLFDSLEELESFSIKYQFNLLLADKPIKIDGKVTGETVPGGYSFNAEEFTKLYNKLRTIYDLEEASSPVQWDMLSSVTSGIHINRAEFIKSLEKQYKAKHILEDSPDLTPELIAEITEVFNQMEACWVKLQDTVLNKEHITLNGESLLKTSEAADQLIANATKKEENKSYVDLSGFSPTIQNLLLQQMIGKKITLGKTEKFLLEQYKGHDSFSLFNGFCRGQLSEMDSLFHNGYTIQSITEDLLHLSSIFKQMPGLKQDQALIIMRKGKGVQKDFSIGADNMYSSFVSFASNPGFKENSSTLITYERLLEGSSSSFIPMELLDLDSLLDRESECEILTSPFKYTVKDFVKSDLYSSIVSMNQITDIPMEKILEYRIHSIIKNSKAINERTKNKLQKKIEEGLHITKKGNKNKTSNELFFENEETENDNFGNNQYQLSDILSLIKNKGQMSDILQLDTEIATRDPLQYSSRLHGIDHTRRVTFNARVLGILDNLSESEMRILLTASQYHDIGRESDDEDVEHGSESSKKILASGKLDQFTQEDKDLICFLIAEHSKSKNDNEHSLSDISDDKREEYKKMLSYLKDADKLDRVRLGDLDPSRLSLETSKKLTLMSFQSFECIFDMFSLEKLENMDRDCEKALEAIARVNENPFNPDVQLEDLSYYDEKTFSDKALTEDMVNASKKITLFSHISQLAHRAKIRSMQFFKNQSNKIEDPHER